MMTKKNFYVTAVGMWLVLLAIAVSVGTVRALLIEPLMGEQTAHVVGTLGVVCVMLIVTYFYVRRIRSQSAVVNLWLIGGLWLLLTVGFEFLFFHYVMGKPWDALLMDYNIFEGRIWILVLAVTFLGPPITGQFLRMCMRKPEST